MQQHHTTWLGWVAGLLFIGSCQSTPGSHHPGGLAGHGRGKPRAHVEVPPGLDADAVTPLSGEALERAKWTLSPILTSLPKAPWQDPGGKAPAPRDDALPLAAQRAYVTGRQAWHDGRIVEAKRQLESALSFAPKRPEILRLLGRIYSRTGNKIRGAYYLKQAVAVDPTNLENMYLLGRIALEQRNWPEAISTLGTAIDLADPYDDPAIPRLIHYFLALALKRDGYALASMEQLHAFMEGSTRLRYATPYARELVRSTQQHLIWLSIGDLHHALNQPAEALRVYQRAAELGATDEMGLGKRLLYTFLRLGRDDQAQSLVVTQIRHSRGDASTVRLVGYLTDQGIAVRDLAKKLQRVYEKEDRPPALVLALADLYEPRLARDLLTDHLKARPQDELVFKRLIDRWLLPQGAASGVHPALEEAIRITAAAIMAAPDLGEKYATFLIRTADDMGTLVEAFESLPEDQRRQPVILVLHGLAVGRAGDLKDAEAMFQAAMQNDPGLLVARLQMVKLMILRNQFKQAACLLEPLADSKDPTVISLRVRMLIATDQITGALVLLDQMIQGGSVDTTLILQKAQLQRRQGQTGAAEETLLDALNLRQTEEVLYEALFELYNSSDRPSDFRRGYQRLMLKMLGTIPQSRIARLKWAELRMARRQFPEAETLLLELVEENGRDAEVLRNLLEIYASTKRHASGIELLQQKLTAHPNDRRLLVLALEFFLRIKDTQRLTDFLEQKLTANPDDRPLLMLGLSYYQRIGDFQRTLQVQERMALLIPEGPQRAGELAEVYLRTDRLAEAIEVIKPVLAQARDEEMRMLTVRLAEALCRLDRKDEAKRQIQQSMEKFPDQAAELGYLWAVTLSRRIGDEHRAEQEMIEVLSRFPDHAPTNNDLGYIWAVQNRNLEQARVMVEKAVQADRRNSAYLDSLGWVYYKLGQFKEAEVWLRKSRTAEDGKGQDPVIFDHLGDTLYRLGQRDEAARAWAAARALLPKHVPILNDPERDGLAERLSEKIQAVRHKRDAPVADLPDEMTPQSKDKPVPEPESVQSID